MYWKRRALELRVGRMLSGARPWPWLACPHSHQPHQATCWEAWGGKTLVSLPLVTAKTSSCNTLSPLGSGVPPNESLSPGTYSAFTARPVAHPKAGREVSGGGWRRRVYILSPGTGRMVLEPQTPSSGTVSELKMDHIIPPQETSTNWLILLVFLFWL